MFSKSTRVAAAAVTAGALFLAGCSTGDTEGGGSTTPEQSAVTIGLNAEPANLDFSTTDGAAIPQALLDNVYEGLVTLSDAGEIEPLLAQSWEVSDDNTTYDFTLQSGATFSDGTPFTAETVKWNIENVQSDNWTISLKSYMDVVESVEVVSDEHVTVVLSAPSNDWLFRMTTRVGAMFNPDAVDDLANTAVGTGPFTVTAFNRGDSLELTARDDYWGEQPAVPSVKFQYFSDVNAMNSALLSGSIDAVQNFTALDTIAQFEDPDSFTVLEGGTNAEVVLSMNNASGIFTDVKARQAVNYAINREALVANATSGYGQLIGSMVPPTDPWFDEALVDAYPYDPDMATTLIEEAGIEGATIRFRVPNLSNLTAAYQMVESDLTAVGFNVELETLEFPAQWLEQVFTNHDYDMSIINHVEARDIATYADPTYYWGYDSSEFQDLVSSADSGTAEDQVTYLTEAAQMLSDDAVSDWLYLEPNITILKAGLTGFPENILGESLNVTDLSWN